MAWQRTFAADALLLLAVPACRQATQYTGEEVNGVGIYGVCNSAVAIVSSRAETAEMQALLPAAS